MAIAINGSGTVTGISVGGLPDGIVDAGTLASNSVEEAKIAATSVSPLKRKGGGSVLQIAEATGNTATYSSATSYTETVITGSITPLKSDSTIYVDVAAPMWPAANTYQHIQLRSSGGNTNNDIGTWGDNYANPSAFSFNIWVPFKHTSHSTTSAITYKIFTRKQGAVGSNWYFPNNNTGNSTISWTIRMTEVLS